METPRELRILNNAVQARRPGLGLLHHSDRGCQYESDVYRDRLDGPQRQLLRKRRHESFWSPLKLEWFHRTTFPTLAEVEPALFTFIDGLYDTRRFHSSLGHLSPVDFQNHSPTNLTSVYTESGSAHSQY